MATWINGDALMKHWDLWTWTDHKGMPHEFAYIPAPVVTRAIEAAKNSGVEMKPVVHAHWFEDDDGVHCSNCKKDAPLEVFTYSFNPTNDSWDGDVKFNKSEFCPHCGRKMDEVINDET